MSGANCFTSVPFMVNFILSTSFIKNDKGLWFTIPNVTLVESNYEPIISNYNSTLYFWLWMNLTSFYSRINSALIVILLIGMHLEKSKVIGCDYPI